MVLTRLHASVPDRTHKQVELTLWHAGCWTLAVTDEHASTHLIEKSLYTADELIKGDFVLVSKGSDSIEAIIETIDRCEVVNDVTVLKRSDGRARVVVIYDRQSSIVPEIVNSAFMPIEPVHITGGREHWTVMVRADILAEAVEEMEADSDIEITSIHEVDPTEGIAFADVIDRVHDDLSARQRELLFEARKAGYYNWPREVSACAVAEDVGISGSTLLEHIRRGEQKILQTVFEELENRHPRR